MKKSVVKEVNPGDVVQIGNHTIYGIDTVWNIKELTTLKRKDVVLFTGPSDTPIIFISKLQ